MKKFRKFLNKDVQTVDHLAQKHQVSVDYIQKQLKSGTSIEHEHSTSNKVARRIALAHIGERPDYYVKLIKYVEKKPK
jgi:hypothetical protein